jgi:hypothetical protein
MAKHFLTGSLKITTSVAEIEREIKRCMEEQISKSLVKVSRIIGPTIRQLVAGSIRQSPEYSSIINGQLRLELGVPDGLSALESIINELVSSIVIEFDKKRLYVELLSPDYTRVTDLPAAKILIEKGYIPWLKWLLLFGDDIIIKNYEVHIDNTPGSRTGLAVMVAKQAGFWRVPPQYSGTIDNNFITRSVDALDKQISDLIEKEVYNNL